MVIEQRFFKWARLAKKVSKLQKYWSMIPAHVEETVPTTVLLLLYKLRPLLFNTCSVLKIYIFKWLLKKNYFCWSPQFFWCNILNLTVVYSTRCSLKISWTGVCLFLSTQHQYSTYRITVKKCFHYACYMNNSQIYDNNIIWRNL